MGEDASVHGQLKYFKKAVKVKQLWEIKVNVFVSWVVRETRADMTKHINYDCQFDQDGVCKKMRSDNFYRDLPLEKRRKCCCSSCAHAHAYLNTTSKKAKAWMLENFDCKDGFWREGKGCIMPRKWRSDTCLSHNCGTNQGDDLSRVVDAILYRKGGI